MPKSSRTPRSKRRRRSTAPYSSGKSSRRRLFQTSSTMASSRLSRGLLRAGVTPKVAEVKLRYVQLVVLNGPSSSTDYIAFSCNGMWNPSSAVLDHQPHGFDTLMSLYARYRVLSSKITAEFVPTGSGSDGANIGFIRTDHDQGVLVSGIEANIEKDGTVYGVCGDADNGGRLKLSKTWSAKSWFHDFRDDAHSGNADTNPTRQAHFIVGVGPVASGSDPAAVNVVVTMEYRAEFYEKKEIPQS